MPTSLKGWCVHCRGRVQAPVDQRDAIVECPHCGKDVSISAAVEYRQRFHRTRRRIWMAVALLAAIALGALGYVLRTELSLGFDVLTEETGSTTAAVVSLVVGLLVLFWVALWLLLPVAVYIGLKDLRRRASELDETTKLCARHLARLTGKHDQPSNGQPLEQKACELMESRPESHDDARQNSRD